MRICYLDAFSGISGDMTVGALADAGANPAALTTTLATLGLGASYRLERTTRQGLAAAKFVVDGGDNKTHRHLRHVLEIIDRSAMTPRAKERARAVFSRLAEAEAAVHGTTPEKVHFHEVGAVDSISDICGAAVALDLLAIEAVYSSAVNLGSGTVKTAHGVLPVPTPATARLLEGKPVYSRGPALELTTPTGAAIAVTLASDFGPPPAMRLTSCGYGAGDRDFADHANVLRVLVGESTAAAESTTVYVLEANIDDSTPEVLGYALDRLMSAGALDASLQPLWMKKNRPGSLLRVIAKPEDRESLAAVILRETSTLGLRLYPAERRVEERRIVEVTTPHGAVRVKVASNGTFAPEFDDCSRIARETGVPLKDVLAQASAAYLRNTPE